MAVNEQVTISHRWLLSVYAVVPLLFLLVGIDTFFFDGALQPYLTASATYLPLYLLIFEMPHIIASFTTFADKEYVRYYRSHLSIYLPVVLVLFGVLFYYSLFTGFLLYILFTMYHVMRQQTGIFLIVSRKKDWLHELWVALGVISSFLGFVLVYGTVSFEYGLYAGVALIPLLFLFLLVGVVMFVRSKTKMARAYVVAITATLLASYSFLLLDYLFLSVLVLRFVHDVTAFMFYISHDRNRSLEGGNYVIDFFKKIRLPVVVATPLFAIAIAFLIRSGLDAFQIGVVFLLLLGVTHYYLEGVMWKFGTPHRKRVPIQ